MKSTMKRTTIIGYLNQVEVEKTIVTHKEGSTREIALAIHDMGARIGDLLQIRMISEII